jgi:AcrR family transcriptional regulator
VAVAAGPTTTRGSLRREQLLAASAGLFRARGYHNVSLEDIAAEVDLTGPAVYRHFRNKHDILAQLLTRQIGDVLAVSERPPTPGVTPEARLEVFVREVAGLVLERDNALLWRQERRHLTGDDQERFRRFARRLKASTSEVIRDVRPDLSADDLELLTWSVLSAFSRVRTYRAALPRPDAERYLTTTAMALTACELAPDAGQWPTRRSVPRLPRGRRERIIEAAIRLLNGRGYHAVGIEEIAAESETAIATVYQYFSSKSELLHAILARSIDVSHYSATRRLWTVTSPRERLDALVEDHAHLAFGPHGRLLSIFDADLIYLPEAEQEDLRRSAREYSQEWADTLRELRPELTAAEAGARAWTGLGLLADIAQTHRQAQRRDIATRAAALVHIVLEA